MSCEQCIDGDGTVRGRADQLSSAILEKMGENTWQNSMKSSSSGNGAKDGVFPTA